MVFVYKGLLCSSAVLSPIISSPSMSTLIVSTMACLGCLLLSLVLFVTRLKSPGVIMTFSGKYRCISSSFFASEIFIRIAFLFRHAPDHAVCFPLHRAHFITSLFFGSRWFLVLCSFEL